jgi:putative selenium metabolism hydrolase
MTATVSEILTHLVRVPGRSGEEQEMATAVAAAMAELRFDAVTIDPYGSVLGTIHGDRSGPTVLLDGHMDTVSPASPDQWSHAVYGAEMSQGRLWGLGAADTKGSLSAMLCAGAGLRGAGFPGTLIVAASVAEENLTGAALGHILQLVPADLVITGEPTQLRLGIAQKGRIDLLLQSTGKSSHTSHPELGENAVYKAIAAVERLRALPWTDDPLLGTSLLELVEMTSQPQPGSAQVPDGCRVRFSGRVMPEESRDALLLRLRGALEGLPGVHLEFEKNTLRCYTGRELVHDGWLPGWRTPEISPWLTRIRQTLRDHGLPDETFGAGFGTNGSASAGRFGLPTLIYGPGSLDQAHAIDEFIDLAQLEQAVVAYRLIVTTFLKGE